MMNGQAVNWKHPNLLEVNGSRYYSNWRPLSSCPMSPLVVIVTINRVQEVYENPIYGGNKNDPKGIDNLETLDQLFCDDLQQLHLDFYHQLAIQGLDRAHIGEFVLQSKQ